MKRVIASGREVNWYTEMNKAEKKTNRFPSSDLLASSGEIAKADTQLLQGKGEIDREQL